MNEEKIQHVLARNLDPLDDQTIDAMFELFSQICRFWKNLENPEQYRSRLVAFMLNRINFDPHYHGYYRTARDFIAELKAEHGEEGAYKFLFTENIVSGIKPPTSRLAITRQLVSNEFISLQLAAGGFKAWGAKNYLGFFGGPNIEGQPPYRHKAYRESKE